MHMTLSTSACHAYERGGAERPSGVFTKISEAGKCCNYGPFITSFLAFEEDNSATLRIYVQYSQSLNL